MISAPEPRHCPACSAGLPPGAPQALCPACLLRQALASRTVFDPAAPSANTLPPPSPAEIADKFPQFEIAECLGRGGMGVVYRARQKSLDRWVALKILAPERVGQEKFAERFAREAQILGRLNHPHIVAVHDHGRTDGLFYIVMEFVDGVNLRDLLRDGRLEPKQALAIVPPICEALQYAHDKGVVHRDIKPENLLLDREGRVKIADFGIAALIGSGGPGEFAGTPPYMAPEQAGAAPGTPGAAIDHRADIYALGVVLYELLTGERPAPDAVAPSKKVRIDVRLDEIVLRALEKTPALRYQTAGEFRTCVEILAAPPQSPAGEDRQAPSALPANAAPAPRLPRPAVIGAVWTGFAMALALQGLVLSWIGPAAFNAHDGFLPGRRFILLFGFTAPVGATILGWIALGQIRRSGGRLRGLGLALFLVLFFPLGGLDLALAWPLFSQIGPIRDATLAPVLLRLLAALALLLGNVFLVRGLWRRLTGARPTGRLFGAGGLAIVCALAIAGLCWFRTLPPAARTALFPRTPAFFGRETAAGTGAETGVSPGDETSIIRLAARRSPHLQCSRARIVADGPWVAQLPDGGSVELLAVRLQPSDHGAWLRPDGSPASYDPAITCPLMGGSHDAVVALARVRRPGGERRWPNPDGTPRQAPAGLEWATGRAFLNGKELPYDEYGLIEFRSPWVSSFVGAETTLRLGVATMEYQTILTKKIDDVPLSPGPTSPNWTIAETPAGLRVGITQLVASPTREYRLVAVDGTGTEHGPSMSYSNLFANGGLGTFSGLFSLDNTHDRPTPLRHIREVRWKARPYEIVEFRGVSLRPGHRTTVEIRDFAPPPTGAPVPGP